MVCSASGDCSIGGSCSVPRVQPGQVASAGCPFVRVLIKKTRSVT